VTQLLGKSILEGRDVSLTIHRVAEISIKTGVLKVDFMVTTGAAPSPAGRPSAAAPGSPVSARSSEKARDSARDAKIQRQHARERAAEKRNG